MDDQIHIAFKRLNFTELDQGDQELIRSAEQALEKAHAPYSEFSVGSAIRMSNQDLYTGNNQENAAYPSGLCAERVALFKCKSETKDPIETIVVMARNSQHESANAFPCGACRQVMMEYASQQKEPIRILMRQKDKSLLLVEDVRKLLPFSFDPQNLK